MKIETRNVFSVKTLRFKLFGRIFLLSLPKLEVHKSAKLQIAEDLAKSKKFKSV